MVFLSYKSIDDTVWESLSRRADVCDYLLSARLE